MKKSAFKLLGLLATLFAVCQAPAQTGTQLEPMGATNLNRFGVSYRMGFNLSVDFQYLGGFSALNPVTNPRHPLRTPNNDLFNYDNGYIYPDSTPNAHPGYTWYYGYVAGTPQRPGDAPTDFDLYRSSSAANLSSRNNESDPQHGLELTYNRQLGRLGVAYWGVESGLGFTDFSIQDNRNLHATVMRATDTYRTGGGAILKPAPFSGTFQGPDPLDTTGWPLVGLTPVNSGTESFVGAATVAAHRDFEARLISMRLGPYLDLPIGQRWTFSLSAGLVLLEVMSDFKFDESVTVDQSVTLTPLPSEQHRGSGSKDELLVGGYAAGTFSYALSERLKVFAGAQFQSTGNYSHTEAGKTAVLHLAQSIFVPVGMSFSF